MRLISHTSHLGLISYGTSRAGLPLVQRAWRPDAYNTLAIPMHRFGRCTGRDVSCVGLHSDCPPPPPPFTKEVALAGKREEMERARARGIRHRAERAAKTAAKTTSAAKAAPGGVKKPKVRLKKPKSSKVAKRESGGGAGRG